MAHHKEDKKHKNIDHLRDRGIERVIQKDCKTEARHGKMKWTSDGNWDRKMNPKERGY